MLIDTHAHLNFNAFKNDFNEVIKRSLAENVWMINVGTKYETSKRAVEIAEKYEGRVYAAVGLHPIHLKTDLVKIKTDPVEGGFETAGEDFDKDRYKELVSSEKVVAIGEIGLDYYYRPKTKKKLALFKEKQRELFLEELNLAKELDLPMIFHCRMAHNDLLEILKKFQVPPSGESRASYGPANFKFQGVIHCFTGSWEQAKEYLDMGFYLGFNGIIYKLDLKEVIEKTPLKKILIETDCPFLTPPQAKKERNEPIFVKYIAQDIAKIKNLSYEKVIEITTKNARELFKI